MQLNLAEELFEPSLSVRNLRKSKKASQQKKYLGTEPVDRKAEALDAASWTGAPLRWGSTSHGHPVAKMNLGREVGFLA